MKRFDSNCYIALTRKLDTHDVSRHRVPPDTPNPVAVALSQIKQPALVIGIESDGLRTIHSPEGHDAFLLQFEQVNKHILEFFNEVLPDIMDAPGLDLQGTEGSEEQESMKIAKSSTFGEAEVEDITAW